MKTSKSKGFTLIELMVVISIIALLSSIVLASVGAAREKAMLTKTVGEMKSLQNAVELYKNQFGKYPGESERLNYDDDPTCNYFCAFFSSGNMDTFFTSELVNRKFISKVPHAPNYPNNCNNADCSTKGYILGYSIIDYDTDILHKDNISSTDYFMCGSEKVKNYFIYFWANNKKLNLPVVGLMQGGSYITYNAALGGVVGTLYCISM